MQSKGMETALCMENIAAMPKGPPAMELGCDPSRSRTASVRLE
jgi:hypothetical protein